MGIAKTIALGAWDREDAGRMPVEDLAKVLAPHVEKAASAVADLRKEVAQPDVILMDNGARLKAAANALSAASRALMDALVDEA